MPLLSINPATGELIHRFPATSPTRLDLALTRSATVFREWRATSLPSRTALAGRLAQTLQNERDTLAALITSEMGKPITQSRAEIDKCAAACTYYAAHGEVLLEPAAIVASKAPAHVVHEPLGPVLAIMPWNFPFWQVIRAAVPALLAGNTVLLKHASNVCGCALACEEVLRRAGFPVGAFQPLLIPSSRLSTIIRDDRVRGVTLTGSTEAGRKVAAVAAGVLKPCVLELGGSDPYLILGDADLDLAAEACAEARLLNSGQSCIAAKRFIVVEAVRAEFERRFVRSMAARQVGDPLDEATQVGPLAREDLRQTLQQQVQESVERGATVLLGGHVLDRSGFYFSATVLTSVAPGMPAFDDELFGPAAAIVHAPDEEAAIALANRSRFGLGAAVFTRDRKRGEEIARTRLDAGQVFVNTFVRSDPALPFGGMKESGYGRELGSWGMASFVNVKTLWVE